MQTDSFDKSVNKATKNFAASSGTFLFLKHISPFVPNALFNVFRG